jgi:photosystem II stability/assembly factor-like uncharacterized protein
VTPIASRSSRPAPARSETPSVTGMAHPSGATRTIPRVGPLQIVSRTFAVAVFSDCRTEPYRCTEGLRTTMNFGRTWSDITPPTLAKGVAITDIDFVDPEHGWVMAYSCNAPRRSEVWRTNDGGASWARIGKPPMMCADATGHSLDMVTSVSGWESEWVRMGPTTLSRTSDAGASWSGTGRLPTPGDIRFVDGSLGFLAGFPESPTLYRSSDGGASWWISRPAFPGNRRPVRSWVSLPTFFRPDRGVEPVDVAHGQTRSVVFDTTRNGGATWSLGAVLQPRVSDQGSVPSIAIASPTTWWVTIGKPASVYVTGDAGQSWHRHATSLPAGEIYAIGRWKAWLVSRRGDASRLFLTTAGGKSWHHIHP